MLNIQVVCSGVVDSQVIVTNMAGQDMSLTRDEDGNIEVDGVKLFMKDKMTTNGVIHVIGIKVLIVSSVYNISHFRGCHHSTVCQECS